MLCKYLAWIISFDLPNTPGGSTLVCPFGRWEIQAQNRALSAEREMFYIVVLWLLHTYVYTFVEIHQAVHLICASFACKLSLNKVYLLKKYFLKTEAQRRWELAEGPIPSK